LLQGSSKSLRKSGINIVAIHSHMEGDSPKVLYLHYWGAGPTEKLAHELKVALETQSTKAATK
jgi:hypothetical protein